MSIQIKKSIRTKIPESVFLKYFVSEAVVFNYFDVFYPQITVHDWLIDWLMVFYAKAAYFSYIRATTLNDDEMKNATGYKDNSLDC